MAGGAGGCGRGITAAIFYIDLHQAQRGGGYENSVKRVKAHKRTHNLCSSSAFCLFAATGAETKLCVSRQTHNAGNNGGSEHLIRNIFIPAFRRRSAGVAMVRRQPLEIC